MRLVLARPLSHTTRTRVLTEPESSSAAEPNGVAPEEIELRLVGANPAASLRGEEALSGASNYFTGRKTWRTGVKQYARVRCREVYPGIDLIYYGQQQQLEYDFHLALALIRASFDWRLTAQWKSASPPTAS
jgi:hypothetical protein